MKRRKFIEISSKSTIAMSVAPVILNNLHTSGAILENDYFRYKISEDGHNLEFVDKASGIDYCDHTAFSYCAFIIRDGKEYHTSSVSQKGNTIDIEFHEAGASGKIRTEVANDCIILEVLSVKGTIESMIFLNVPLKLEGMPYEPFAACVLSLNLFTHVRQLPALMTHLWVSCYKRFRMEGSKIALIGVQQKDILPTIKGIMKGAKDIPLSTAGGAWAQEQEVGYGSYLINFGTLTEETVDEWIGICRRLGFNQIDFQGGGNGSFFTFGDLELNPKKWPDGWDHFKRINKRLHDAGIYVIFHTYAFFIDKISKYVTPVPHADLGYFRYYTLAESINTADNEIAVKETMANVSTTSGTLRIGNELIEFSGITDTRPYKFTGCKRGINGTKPSAYGFDEKAYHLKEMFGMFVAGAETALFYEIAHHTAEIVNNCNFDGIYFDAIDGSGILAGSENFWYYGTEFIFEVAKRLERPVGMEMSSMSHHWWHYRSRWQAWDRPVRGYKRFVDIHSASIKSGEFEHGTWQGNLPLIKKFAAAQNGGLLLPLHLGWWGNQTWNPPQVEPTFPDDVEYLCCKMIGNNAGISMIGGADEKTLNGHPLYRKLIAIIRQYEELRHKHYFSEGIKKQLRQAGNEFTLFRDDNGSWNFKPVQYNKHKVKGLDHPSATWSVHNEFDSQPVKLRIEPLMSVKPYNDPDNIVLADFLGSERFINLKTAEGVTGGIEHSMEKVISSGPSGRFTAYSSGGSPQEGSWIKMEKSYVPLINLEKHQALGVWVYGDGNGELLNLRIQSKSSAARGDHFIHIDFEGWKYFELVEIESSEFSNYTWPNSNLYVYCSYRISVKLNSVDKLQLWYNNIPAGKKIECFVSPVKALPMVPVTIKNPSVTVRGKTVTFPVIMESGQYLEFRSGSDCILFGSKGETLQKVLYRGEIPVLESGMNSLTFSCEHSEDINIRTQVTIISAGEPMDNV